MSFKAYAPITTHPTETKRLPKDIREALPEEARAKVRLYPKDIPRETLEEIHKRFWTALEPLRQSGKLGAVLLQFPDWFVISGENKDAIVRARDLLPDDRLAIEFRNATWLSERNRDETLRFLREHGLSYVMVDEPQGFPSSIPAENWKKKGITAAERFDYRYSQQELLEWVPKIRKVAEQARETHLLMNNCYGDKAVNNAAELSQLLLSDGVPS